MQTECSQNTGPTCDAGPTCAHGRSPTPSESTLFAAASPVKTLATQDSWPESKAVEADCSTKQSESFANWSREFSFWKTSQRSLLTEWEKFSESWPRSGLMRNGSVYRRLPLASRTTEIGFSFVPTARAQYRSCSANRVMSGDDNSNIEDWLAIRLRQRGPIKGLKVNLTWLRWFMGFPTQWGVTELEKDLATPSSPKSPSGSAGAS